MKKGERKRREKGEKRRRARQLHSARCPSVLRRTGGLDKATPLTTRKGTIEQKRKGEQQGRRRDKGKKGEIALSIFLSSQLSPSLSFSLSPFRNVVRCALWLCAAAACAAADAPSAAAAAAAAAGGIGRRARVAAGERESRGRWEEGEMYKETERDMKRHQQR